MIRTYIEFETQDQANWFADKLKEIKRDLEKQISIMTLKIDALETGDYSNISDKMKLELDALIDELKDQSGTPPAQQQ